MLIRLIYQPQTALETVAAISKTELDRQKAELAFYMLAAAAYYKMIDAKKIAKDATTLWTAAGSPSNAKALLKELKAGTIHKYHEEYDITPSAFDPSIRKLAYALSHVAEKGDKHWADIGRLAHLVTDPTVTALWKPQPVKPAANIKDPKARKKAENQYLKDLLISMARKQTDIQTIMSKLDAEMGKGSTKFGKPFPKQIVDDVAVNEAGHLVWTRTGDMLVSRANSPASIWTLRGAKVTLPVYPKPGSYVFQYMPAHGTSPQKVYKQSDVSVANKKKWGTVDQLMGKLPAIKASWQKMLAAGEPLGALLQFAYLTSARIGTVGNNTFGASTLQAKHFTIKSNGTVIVKYPGKGQGGKAVLQEHRLEPNAETKALIKFIKERIGSIPKDQTVFTDTGRPLSNTDINGWLQKHIKGMTVHKFRHLRGTSLAMQVLSKLSVPANVQQAKANAIFKAGVEQIAKALGHYNLRGDEVKISPATAIKHYIDPNLSRSWFEDKGLEVPAFVPAAIE